MNEENRPRKFCREAQIKSQRTDASSLQPRVTAECQSPTILTARFLPRNRQGPAHSNAITHQRNLRSAGESAESLCASSSLVKQVFSGLIGPSSATSGVTAPCGSPSQWQSEYTASYRNPKSS